MARKKKSANESTVQTLASTGKKNWISLTGLKEAVDKIKSRFFTKKQVADIVNTISKKNELYGDDNNLIFTQHYVDVDEDLIGYELYNENKVSFKTINNSYIIGDGNIDTINTEWNYYRFEGGSSSSTVTIDGKSVTIAANKVVEGNFTTDITAIGTNNLKKIKIKGDVSLTIGSSSSNSTVEEVDVEFSAGYSRSLESMFRNLRALKSLRLRGGQPTSCYYMCYYMAYTGTTPCVVDIKDVDFSKCTTCYYMFYYARYVQSIDLSGNDFSSCTTMQYAFRYMTYAKSINLSGCGFSSCTTLSYAFASCTNLKSIDLSGCSFDNVETITSLCSSCSNLKYIVGPFGLSYKGNITVFSNTILTRDSAVNIINALSDVGEGTNYRIQFSDDTLSQLRPEDYALAHKKGWIINSSIEDDYRAALSLMAVGGATGALSKSTILEYYVTDGTSSGSGVMSVYQSNEILDYDEYLGQATLRLWFADTEDQTISVSKNSSSSDNLGKFTLSDTMYGPGKDSYKGFVDLRIPITKTSSGSWDPIKASDGKPLYLLSW